MTDKIYVTIDEAKEFINWIENFGDKEFKKEFNGNSLTDFLSFPKNIENNPIPIAYFPEYVDRWLLNQPTLPSFIANQIRNQYRIYS